MLCAVSHFIQYPSALAARSGSAEAKDKGAEAGFADAQKSGSSKSGRAPVRLQKNVNWAYSFQVDFKPGRLNESGSLVSINAVPLKGKSERAFYKMLEGPVDSTVEIGYLDSTGNAKTVKVQRETLNKPGIEPLKDLESTIKNVGL